jgi:DNA-binding transcriptional MerR regulator
MKEEKSLEAPIFVKIDEYKDVLEVIDIIKKKLSDAKSTLHNIKELKNEEDSELELWDTTLEELEQKLESIDKSLFEPESTW